ncbi:hypothetical protein [uncultured Cohaesibacter sp.]|uniref:hypothetical protein n=1 Tax=uncultured Cohaesibacter sp. TaxID=1002546 RepID=UPI0029C8871B|nr:hypothetical protein [uncultured Cohaesibacter sp.]
MESKYACEALKNHDVLKINYHGYDRDVEVHAVGNTLRGNELMYVYQTSGGSRSGELGWKKMVIEDAKFLGTVNGAARTPRPDYNFDDSGLHDYSCAL